MTKWIRLKARMFRIARVCVGTAVLVVGAACAGGHAVSPAPAHCPELAFDALERFDFVAEWNLDAAVSGPLRSSVEATLVMNELAARLDKRLHDACGTYLTDLGMKPTGASTAEVCGALVRSIVDGRAKLGRAVIVSVDDASPRCGTPADVVLACAAKCDPEGATPSAKATCEAGTQRGTCDALCSGECESSAPAKCGGACVGTCDGGMKGSCSGICAGKCDGKAMKKGGASCAGVCDGTCEGAVEAACSGNCSGRCVLSTATACAGTCTGSCTSEMKQAGCTGRLSTPPVSVDCAARCDAEAMAHVECTPGPVVVRVLNASDPEAARAFKTVAEKDLPALVELGIGLGSRLPRSIWEVRGAVVASADRVRTSSASGQLTACFGKVFADGAVATASLDRTIELALSVKAALASGGAQAPATFVVPTAVPPPTGKR